MAIVAVQQPRRRESALDKIAKGLSIAQSVFNIKSSIEQGEVNKLKLEQAQETKRRQDLFNKMADANVLTQSQLRDQGFSSFKDKEVMAQSMGFKSFEDLKKEVPNIEANIFDVTRARVKRFSPKEFQPGEFQPADTQAASELFDSLVQEGFDVESPIPAMQLENAKSFKSEEQQRFEQHQKQEAARLGQPFKIPRTLKDFDFDDVKVVPTAFVNKIFEAKTGSEVEAAKKSISDIKLKNEKLKLIENEAKIKGQIFEEDARDLIQVEKGFKPKFSDSSLVNVRAVDVITGSDDKGKPLTRRMYYITQDDYERGRKVDKDIVQAKVDESERKARADQSIFKRTDTLRKDYDKASKSTLSVMRNFQRVKAAAAGPLTGPSALSMIFAFNKMIDEGSVVREGEYERTRRVAPLIEMMNQLKAQVKEGAPIDKIQMQRFVDEAEKMMASQLLVQDDIDARYSDLSNKFGVSPVDVVNESFRRQKAQLQAEIDLITRPGPIDVRDLKDRTPDDPDERKGFLQDFLQFKNFGE